MDNLRRIGRRKGQVINLKNGSRIFGLLQQTLFYLKKKFSNMIESQVHKHSLLPKRNFNGWRVSQETLTD